MGEEEVALEVTTRRLQVIKENVALCSGKKETEKVTGALVFKGEIALCGGGGGFILLLLHTTQSLYSLYIEYSYSMMW